MRQVWYGVSHTVLRRTDSAAHCDGRRVPEDPESAVVYASCLEVTKVAVSAERARDAGTIVGMEIGFELITRIECQT